MGRQTRCECSRAGRAKLITAGPAPPQAPDEAQWLAAPPPAATNCGPLQQGGAHPCRTVNSHVARDTVRVYWGPKNPKGYEPQ